ncbi:MAG TPA: T9SS type A sorting domain-containing protein, partial [Bacteroidetes bacterium]|nr:T9SS type A sorting domain-containing protein [Bacteroidota bacterium]HEX05436.1 T9SS type A sorting domain-containing protein [Bacteroidota bacterium]
DGYKIAGDASLSDVLPTSYGMESAYPNPFNPTTMISVSLPKTADLTVAVYNVTGQQVAELADASYGAGTHQFTFDASGMASGLYFVRATVPGQMNQVQKVVLMK